MFVCFFLLLIAFYYVYFFVCFFFFKQKTAYEMLRSLVGSEMCIRDSINAEYGVVGTTPLLYEVFRQYDDRLILYPDHMQRYEKSLSHVYPTASVDANTNAVRMAVDALMKAHADEAPIRQNIKIVSWGPSPHECICYYLSLIHI
eukprot:TRINITY_DN39064_c0_g1_i1.p1 TRINITY_DN39064_c0_g1~~TRINITY_DN39064_c0_g1_i1.p1  ORF type:complete len:145 (+),score=39.31 TRINITY_DN39064_c0_g1_i1:48-482(+)